MSMTMETRPFSIQSPEAIAKEYGGNKQKIAQAMQMGIIDPTAGMLAGMFIDRMRSAAQQEQAPQQTIAQQVFAPPAAPQQMSELDTTLQAAFGPPPRRGGEALPPAPAGLGATPEAAQMMAPPPMEQPMGMAEGGMVPPYMNNGGLAELPVPDGMFDEPHNGSYAGGGIVAFAGGEYIQQGSDEPEADAVGTRLQKPKPKSLGALPSFDIPRSIFGMSGDVMTNMDRLKETYTPQTKQMDRATKAYEEELTPEGLKKRRDEDFGAFLMKFGAKLASTPGDLVTAAGIAGGEALPGLEAASKERRADQRQMLKNLQENEGLSNKEAKEARNLALDMQIKYGSLAVALQDTAFKNLWQQMDDNTKRYVAKLANEASKYGSDKQKEGTMGAAGIAERRLVGMITNDAIKRVDASLPEDTEYSQLMAKQDKTGAAKRRQKLVQDEVKRMFSGDYGAGEDAETLLYDANGKRI
jgi:hypothetical protein